MGLSTAQQPWSKPHSVLSDTATGVSPWPSKSAISRAACGCPGAGQPMRRHTQHQAWQWPTFVSTKLRAHFHPCLVKFIVLNRIHRAAMAQKHDRQLFFRQKWIGCQKSRWVQKISSVNAYFDTRDKQTTDKSQGPVRQAWSCAVILHCNKHIVRSQPCSTNSMKPNGR